MAVGRYLEACDERCEAVVLTPGVMRQLEMKLREACRLGYAEVTLVVEKGRLRWIRGPAPSEAVRE